MWLSVATSQLHRLYPATEERVEKILLFMDLNPKMAATAAELFYNHPYRLPSGFQVSGIQFQTISAKIP